jgi:hypothetical protein
MTLFRVILMVLAFVCLSMAAAGISLPRGNVNLMALGLAFWSFAVLMTLF